MRPRALVSSLFGLTQAYRYGENHVRVRKDPPQVEASFPDPGVTLLSPAFLPNANIPTAFSNGTDGPTSDDTANFFIQTLAGRNDWMTYHPAGYLSEEGRTFSYVFLSSSSQENSTKEGNSKKVRVWLQGGVHGNEPAGDQAILAFLAKMDANQTWTASLLEHVEILVLPRYNPDGVAYFQRRLASNFDPNRDHVNLAREQTRNIKDTFSAFAPHVAADMHEYSAAVKYGDLYLRGSDALYSAAKNLNINPAIRRLSEELFATAIGADLEAGGFRWEPYVTKASEADSSSTIAYVEAGSEAKIGRNAMGLSQAIVFLCETRGIGIADQEFARRTATGLRMLESIVQTSADHATKLIEVVEGGIQDFIDSDEDIVITDYTKASRRNFTMVEYESGKIVQVPVEFSSTTPTIANLTRSRPEAYLIPRAWSDLADRLKVSGLEIETLPQIYRGIVETLTIETLSFNISYHEDIIVATVTTNSTMREVELPAGSYLVSTRQKNAALAFVALEPENADSYVSSSIVPLIEGDEYPVYRVLA